MGLTSDQSLGATVKDSGEFTFAPDSAAKFSAARSRERDFNRLDEVVAKGLATFVEVGQALATIKQRKLYLVQFSTFEDYVEERHEVGPRRANQLIRASDIMDRVRVVGNICSQELPTLPTTESQCRELARVPNRDVPFVWKRVCDYAKQKDVPITAEIIRLETKGYRKSKPSNGKQRPFDEDAARQRLCDSLRAGLDKWPETSRAEAARQMCDFLKKEFNL